MEKSKHTIEECLSLISLHIENNLSWQIKECEPDMIYEKSTKIVLSIK